MKALIRQLGAGLALLTSLLPAPAFAGFQVLGSLSREARLSPGEHMDGRILVQNTGQEVIELEAYQTDYWFASDGTNRYDDAGSLPRSNAKWIHVAPQQLRVPAGETLSFSYTVDVPADADLVGSYWSMLMVAPITQPVAPEGRPGERHVSVQTVMRYGLQLITEVGQGAGSIKVLSAGLAEGDGGVRMDLELENVGTRHVRPRVWLEIFDTTGAAIGRWEGESKRLYPTTSARIAIPLTGLPAGQYTDLMVADLGNDEVFGAQYNLDLKQTP